MLTFSLVNFVWKKCSSVVSFWLNLTLVEEKTAQSSTVSLCNYKLFHHIDLSFFLHQTGCLRTSSARLGWDKIAHSLEIIVKVRWSFETQNKYCNNKPIYPLLMFVGSPILFSLVFISCTIFFCVNVPHDKTFIFKCSHW